MNDKKDTIQKKVNIRSVMNYVNLFSLTACQREELLRCHSVSGYDNVEMVPVYKLIQFREFNRGEKEDERANIEELKASIQENGITEPLIVIYHIGDRSVYLSEGNHRLQAAIELGLKELPVRVVRVGEGGYPSVHEERGVGAIVEGYEPNQYGYVPGDLKPSQIGLI